MATTETRPDLADSDTREGDGYAHYANKTEITRAAIEGGLVTALWGSEVNVIVRPPIRQCGPKSGVSRIRARFQAESRRGSTGT